MVFLLALFLVISVLAKRLAGKSVSNMTYIVSSGTLNLNSINIPSECLLCGDRHSRDNETRPRSIELSVVVSQDCNHAPTTDLIRTFYQHNVTHVKVPVCRCVIFNLLMCFTPLQLVNVNSD